MRDEAWLEGIADIEGSANSLPGVGRIRQFILFVGDVEQRVFRICPQAVRFTRLAEKVTDDFPAPGRRRAIDNRDLTRSPSTGPTVVHAGERRIDNLAFGILHEFNVIGPGELAEGNRIDELWLLTHGPDRYGVRKLVRQP